jgi:hypothetical protein
MDRFRDIKLFRPRPRPQTGLASPDVTILHVARSPRGHTIGDARTG